MRDGDEKEGVGWTDGFLLREPVPENALSGSASQSRLIKLWDDGGKNQKRERHALYDAVYSSSARERGEYHPLHTSQ